MNQIAILLISILALAGCSNINTSSIKNASLDQQITGKTLIIGKIRFIVDGEELEYHLLNRPALYLARNDLQAYFATPETDSNGAFVWTLPAGVYEVAVIFGGLPGTTSYWWRKDGFSHSVNGITDPHIILSIKAGVTQYVGTIEIDVRSRKTTALINILNEPIFDTLNGIKIVDEYKYDNNVLSYINTGSVLKRLAIQKNPDIKKELFELKPFSPTSEQPPTQ